LLVHRLFLLRHAKSSWKDPRQADHDRPLAGRGRRAAKALARHVRERIEPALGVADVRCEPALYGASAGALLERLHDVPDHVGSVMLIGHNPGLQELARSPKYRSGSSWRRMWPSAARGRHERAPRSSRIWP
jgi:phosphohistidine phosphatase